MRTVFSMGTLVATRHIPRITVFDERLLAAGKVTKVALTACRHKFLTIRNAMLTPRTPWHAQEVQNEKIDKAPLTTKTVASLLRRCGHWARLTAGVRVRPLGRTRKRLEISVAMYRSSVWHGIIPLSQSNILIILLCREDVWLSRFSAGNALLLTSPAW